MKRSAQRRSRKWTLFLRWADYFCCLAGLVTLAYCGFTIGRAAIWQTYQGWRLDRALDQSAPPPAPNGRHPGARPTGAVIGRLAIDRIGLSAMVLDGGDADTLNMAVGHVAGTPLPGEPGNVVLAGHRDTFFHPLRKISRNDTITIATVRGTHRYRVESIRIVDAEDTAVLQPSSKPTLTLVTCYPFSYIGPAPERFVVQARELGPEPRETASRPEKIPPSRRLKAQRS